MAIKPKRRRFANLNAVLDAHENAVDQISDYAYFELTRTRRCGWMVFVTTHHNTEHHQRKILMSGQGDTIEEACADALSQQREYQTPDQVVQSVIDQKQAEIDTLNARIATLEKACDQRAAHEHKLMGENADLKAQMALLQNRVPHPDTGDLGVAWLVTGGGIFGTKATLDDGDIVHVGRNGGCAYPLVYKGEYDKLRTITDDLVGVLRKTADKLWTLDDGWSGLASVDEVLAKVKEL